MNAIIVVGSGNISVSASAWNCAMGLEQSCRSSYAYGSVTVHSCELGCCFHRCVMRHKAASAVETHRRKPHVVPVRVIVIGRWLRQLFRRSDKLLISQNVDGSVDVGVARPEKR